MYSRNYVRGLIDTHAAIISRIGWIMRGKFNTCVSETSDIEISRLEKRTRVCVYVLMYVDFCEVIDSNRQLFLVSKQTNYKSRLI